MQSNSFKKKRNKPTSGGNKSSNGSRNNKRPQRQGGGQKKSNLNPALLVKKATQVAMKNYESDRRIEDLPISPNLKECLISKGFRKPTEIQDRTLEALLEKRDLLGIAQTGTGKTGAFLVPIIEQLLHSKQKNFALVMVPTRELATQVEEEFQSMAKGLGIFSACYIGGTNINKDINSLKRAKHVIIGTPGRLLDLHNRKSLNFGNFNTLVLDEFDRMLDMGFVHDVKRIIGAMHKRKHTLLFSATLDKTQEALIVDILHNPVTVKVSTGDTTGDHIDQDIIRLKQGEDKFKVLHDMLSESEFQKVLLFEETKHKANRLCGKLNKVGISADQIHGNKSQNARQRALNSFKQGKIRVLVATDVAARGIDVSDVTHVINYQVPMTFDSYIHRIGRTGRAGKTGKAFTFVEA
ncbi:MAG: DEAD/DEAH box helicase [Cyclobacteriaceae bacterium]|nr:DEAD/DEAH box helicase [Cyclobacteriaceae bacterium]